MIRTKNTALWPQHLLNFASLESVIGVSVWFVNNACVCDSQHMVVAAELLVIGQGCD